MCSPSHSQEPNISSLTTQTPEEPANSTPQPDPDQENPNEVAQDEEPAREDQENPGMMLSNPSVSIALVDNNVGSACAGVLTSPSYLSKWVNKRKKGKGFWNLKRMQSVEKKVQTLVERLNLVPFMPSKKLDFAKREMLLKRIGLWDFVNIDFESNRSSLRTDLLAQLIVTYDPKLRCSYVNATRIFVNRADFARAFKLPVKKEKSTNLVSDGVALVSDASLEELVAFFDDFVSNWMVLHEDEELYIMPDEVVNLTRPVKDGHPEKVDWAGLLWFMIEKELMKGDQLVDCYYASHLQYLIRWQREELLRELAVGDLMEEMEGEAVELREDGENVDYNEELEEDACNEENTKSDDVNECREEETDVLGGPNVELTLGQKVVEEEGVKDADMVDVDVFKEDDADTEQRQWILEGKDNLGEHIGDDRGLDSLEECNEEDDNVEEEEEEEEEEEAIKAEEGFDTMTTSASLQEDGLTGNFLQSMEATQLTFGLQGQLNHESSIDLIESHNELQHMATPGPSFYNNNGKREIVHEHDISHHTLNGGNKRVRVEGPWDSQAEDLGTCLEQMQLLAEKARLMYLEKAQAHEQSSMNHQILLNELPKRDVMIEHLHNTKREEIEKRDGEIYRLNRELFLMADLLEDYRKALKQTDKAFSEYRQRCQLPEEPIYKDDGPGGLVLSITDIEKRRKKEEEEFAINCAILEQKAKDAEKGYALCFGEFLDKVNGLNDRLLVIEGDFKLLKDSVSRRKVSGTSPPAATE